MKRLDNIMDQMDGVVTYELKGGKRVCLPFNVVREFGAAEVLRAMGHEDELPTERLPVMWHGRKVGTVPPDFDPLFIKSKTFLYDARPGDFVREGDVWVAAKNLGPGDLDAIKGFERSDANASSE
jgi:hypothetical protein